MSDPRTVESLEESVGDGGRLRGVYTDRSDEDFEGNPVFHGDPTQVPPGYIDFLDSKPGFWTFPFRPHPTPEVPQEVRVKGLPLTYPLDCKDPLKAEETFSAVRLLRVVVAVVLYVQFWWSSDPRHRVQT